MYINVLRVGFLKNPILQKLRFNTLGDWDDTLELKWLVTLQKSILIIINIIVLFIIKKIIPWNNDVSAV